MKKTLIQLSLLLFPIIAQAQLLTINVLPSTTDANIDTYTNSTSNEYHICYINQSIAPRNELLVFLPGSNGKPNGNDYFDQLAANLGYHVIGLMYPNSPAVGSLCDTSVNADCFTDVRLEIIDGIDRSPLISVNQANSIENRLIKAIQYLDSNNPTQNWGQFLDINGEIIWNKIAVAGHSQGGGHAAMIGKNHVLSRVICLASPKDNYRTPTANNPQYLGVIAPWINQDHVTPTDRYFTFTHIADATGSTPEEQQTIFDLLGLRTIADSISVDVNSPPYNNSRILMTYLAVANGTTIQPHNCVLVDNGVPDIAWTSINKFLDPWTYLLTAPSQTVTSINEDNALNLISVYPNPIAENYLILEIPFITDFKLQYFISDVSGRLFQQGQIVNHKTLINISMLSKGSYIIKFSNGISRKITKL